MTTSTTNALDQPIGAPVPNWTPRPRPPRTPMHGRFCTVEPLDAARHAGDLFAANRLKPDGANWTYLPYGPFDRIMDYRAWAEKCTASEDPLFQAILDAKTGKAAGVASYMRIDPANGVIETGHLNFSLLLQRQPTATEAMFLMMTRVFDELGYRRYEWKCDALNAPSRRAALRLGFTFEGIFRQAVVHKDRNRDTAWFSIIDSEWSALKTAYQTWLAPDNFDATGQQKQRLPDLIAKSRARML